MKEKNRNSYLLLCHTSKRSAMFNSMFREDPGKMLIAAIARENNHQGRGRVLSTRANRNLQGPYGNKEGMDRERKVQNGE